MQKVSRAKVSRVVVRVIREKVQSNAKLGSGKRLSQRSSNSSLKS